MRERDYDALDSCIWRLRGSRRRPNREEALYEDAMKNLVGALEGFKSVDEIDLRDLTIADCCLRSLVAGTASEARLAYRAIGLLALTVGARPNKYYFDAVFGAALAVARNTMHESSDTATLVAALQCIAAVTFAGAHRPEDTHECMKAVMAVFNPRLAPDLSETGQSWTVSPEVLDAAVTAWTLLLSTLVGLNTCPYEWKETTIPPHHLAEILESDDLSVRTAAGVVLAMWAELILTRHASPKNMQEPDDRVANLAADIKHGQCPNLEETSTWARLVQLSFLKRFLGKGFDKHVLHNPLVRDVATVTAADAGEHVCDATNGEVHQWHYRCKVVGVIKSWVQRVTEIARPAGKVTDGT
ncbi:uncharacterized protein [Lolium perenne]|uniref:uncharacterized protein n=1 Tax=Lolium perenne TaxID=4522 RepID=UPI0021F5C037|nr:uncharacterized protein LOC127329281 [Lolium perenne]